MKNNSKRKNLKRNRSSNEWKPYEEPEEEQVAKPKKKVVVFEDDIGFIEEIKENYNNIHEEYQDDRSKSSISEIEKKLAKIEIENFQV